MVRGWPEYLRRPAKGDDAAALARYSHYMSVDAPLPSSPRLIVDLDAIQSNYALMAERSGSAKTAAAIKANAYGLGLEAIAPALADAGCTSFFCAHVSEAMSARNVLGHEAEIFVLNGVRFGEVALMRQKHLIPVLNTPDQIALWNEAAKGAPAALHFDTGLNRLGLHWQGFDMQSTRSLNLTLLMSHLACAATPEHAKNALQRERFEEICKAFPDVRTSLASSAGILLGEDYHYDLTRPGIALYGGAPLDEEGPSLAPVVRIEAPVLQVSSLHKGQGIGYDATYVAKKDMVVATVAIGYADGLPLAASSNGFGRLGGHVVPLVGRISMDLSVFDVSHLETTPNPGDILSLLGEDMETLAKASNTLSYALLTGLGPRFVREYKGCGA
jgi:alanine racemase